MARSRRSLESGVVAEQQPPVNAVLKQMEKDKESHDEKTSELVVKMREAEARADKRVAAVEAQVRELKSKLMEAESDMATAREVHRAQEMMLRDRDALAASLEEERKANEQLARDKIELEDRIAVLRTQITGTKLQRQRDQTTIDDLKARLEDMQLDLEESRESNARLSSSLEQESLRKLELGSLVVIPAPEKAKEAVVIPEVDRIKEHEGVMVSILPSVPITLGSRARQQPSPSPRLPLDSSVDLNLSSPMERIINVLTDLKCLPADGFKLESMQAEFEEKVSSAIMLITKNPNLFTADLEEQVKDRHISMDDEMVQWLLGEMGSKRGTTTSLMGSQMLSATEPVVCDASTLLRVIKAIPEEQFRRWDFDIFKEVDEQLSISTPKLLLYIARISAEYNSNPYHNRVHAADVLQSLFCLLGCLKEGTLSPLEKLAALVAAATHDVDHPGTNNSFQIATYSKLALIHNDKSVLENHHLSTSFRILFEDESVNWMNDLSMQQQRELRALWIELVLATDMSRHLDLTSKFKVKAKTGFDFGRPDDRLLVMQLLLKVCDIGNVSKPLELSKRWVELCTEEFFQQGDKEREMGMQISPFMDRNAAAVPKSQVGFINVVAKPLVVTLFNVAPSPVTKSLTDNMRRNLDYWKSQQQQQQQQEGPGSHSSVAAAAPSQQHGDRPLLTRSPSPLSHSHQQPKRTATFGRKSESDVGVLPEIKVVGRTASTTRLRPLSASLHSPDQQTARTGASPPPEVGDPGPAALLTVSRMPAFAKRSRRMCSTAQIVVDGRDSKRESEDVISGLCLQTLHGSLTDRGSGTSTW
eukprot:m51a1_g2863 putative camp-specific 3 -cyclic phosphodiesterase 4d isoform x9 (816) ;mRNA; f:346072-348979